jgi:hypothetical protein
VNELIQVGGVELDVFDAADQQESDQVRDSVEILIGVIKAHESTLSKSYVSLGALVNKAITRRFWIGWGYQSSGSYVDWVGERIGRERSSIYAYQGIAEKLLTHISQTDLENMGVSKAMILQKFVVSTSRRVPPELLASALSDKKISEFKADVFREMHQEQELKGKWRDLGGAYYTPEEWAEVKQAVDLAKVVDPAIDPNLPDHAVTKEVMLRFAREFYSSNIGQ